MIDTDLDQLTKELRTAGLHERAEEIHANPQSMRGASAADIAQLRISALLLAEKVTDARTVGEKLIEQLRHSNPADAAAFAQQAAQKFQNSAVRNQPVEEMEQKRRIASAFTKLHNELQSK